MLKTSREQLAIKVTSKRQTKEKRKPVLVLIQLAVLTARATGKMGGKPHVRAKHAVATAGG